MARLINLHCLFKKKRDLRKKYQKFFESKQNVNRREAWWKKTHVQEVVGLNPTVYWMDVSDASYYISNEKKKRIKVANWGSPKKYLKQKQNVNL
jgi:hypothetical protein